MYGTGGAVETSRRLPTSTRDGFVLLDEATGGLPMVIFRLMDTSAEVMRLGADEVRAFGFSPDERTMVIAESSALTLLSR